MSKSSNQLFLSELEKRCETIRDYILDERFVSRFHPEDIRWAVTAYVRYGGKRLRPTILLFSCGVVGGNEEQAIPAAAAVEIFHTWTLVHDDIIDRDDLRRGKDTVHTHYTRHHSADGEMLNLPPDEAHHYGESIAILTGDIQHGWGISMMAELSSKRNVDQSVTLELINELDTKVLNTLVEGEVLDIQFSHRNIQTLTPSMIEDMLWKKTGALYEFCGRAGAMVGLGKTRDARIDAVARFAALCGTAFQLQDDILGIVGEEKVLGKPIGSDLREGKRTLMVYQVYHNASEAERGKMMNVLGNQEATEAEVQYVIDLMRDKGGIEYVSRRAKSLIEEARPHLDILPESKSKELLYDWANYMIEREF